MISGYVSDVLIKEMNMQGIDKVFIVNNLPKHLLYSEIPKTVFDREKDAPMLDPEGGKKEVLLDGLELHKHDGAIAFPVKRQHVRQALDNIDRYIDRMFPRDVKPAERISYAERPGDMRSGRVPRHKIPVVDIPLPEGAKVSESASQVSPRAQALPVGADSQFDVELIKRQAIEEYKAEKRASMAKARESKKK